MIAKTTSKVPAYRGLPVSVHVSFQRIADTMVSAFEGGSKYWCGGLVEAKQEKDFDIWYADPKFWALPNFEVTFHHDGLTSDEGANDHTTHIGPFNLKRGLTIMSNKYPSHFADMLNEEGDANTGDVLLQCVVLGDVIFG